MSNLACRKIFETVFNGLEIFTYTEKLINSNMHIVLARDCAVIIDPIADDPALSMMHDRQVRVLKILLTHEHYDHISGVNYFKTEFPCEVICSSLCAEALSDPKKNLSRYYNLVLQAHIGKALQPGKEQVKPYSCNADIIYKHEYEAVWGNHFIRARAVGGHSPGSSIFFLNDKIVFSGDNLIPEENTIVDLPGGSKEAYIQVVKPLISSLESNVMVFPGHGVPMMLKDILKKHPDYND